MILDRYLGRTIAIHTGIVFLVLLALFSFTMFVTELGDVGKGRYTLTVAAQYVALSLPRLGHQLFPAIALLGTIIGLGVLASSSELLVLRASGVSILRIVSAAMKTGLILMAVATVLGEVLAPMTERAAVNLRSTALSEQAALMTSQGYWVRDGQSFVFIGNVFPDGSLGNIKIYEMGTAHQILAITHAARAFHVDESWMLQGIVRNNISEQGVRTEHISSQSWDSLLNPRIVGAVSLSPEFLPMTALYQYIQYLQGNGLNAQVYEQAFWKKIMSPLATGVMVFLGVPFVFGPLRSVAIGQRVLVGVFVGIGFYIATQVVGFTGQVYALNPFLVVFFPICVFFLLGVLLLRRAL